MDARQQRGLVIAATCNIEKAQRGAYYVPSQTRPGAKYRVEPHRNWCDCPDHQAMGLTCKHLHAVQYVVQRERNADGTTTVTETLTVTETVETKKRTTYPQNWPAYNAAQSVEKDRFQRLLVDLCRGVPEPEHAGRGRKPHTVRDSLFAMVFKVYSTFSSRRFSCDLADAHRRGFLSRPVPGLKVPQIMENADYTPILTQLVAESSLPLRAVETNFAVDSSGFGSSRTETWFSKKYDKPKKVTVWVKVHIACGVKTNVVTAVRILDANAADSPQLPPLMTETAKAFKIGEVSADKAYGSVKNFDTVAALGGEPFFAFKSNVTGASGGVLGKMFHYFQFKQDEYLAHYHKRSNVESTFSAIKRKFGGEVRSRTDVAMKNEALCKLIAHNLCVLVQESHELGIAAEFWKDEPDTRVSVGIAAEFWKDEPDTRVSGGASA
jgi:transposase